MNKKGVVQVALFTTLIKLIIPLAIIIILSIFFGFFARFTIGLVLFALGIYKLFDKTVKKRTVWWVLIVVGAIFMINPYDSLSALNITGGSF